jgi:hypothetical protein
MIQLIIWWGPIALMMAGWTVLAGWVWFHFPDRTPDDVIDFLQHIDLDKAESLLDPGAEHSLRMTMSPRNFRRLQRKRVHLYVEFLKRMSHNAKILVELGNRLAEGGPYGVASAATAMQQDGIAVRLYTLTTLLKLRFWLLIRLHAWFMLPSLSLCDARETCGICGLDAYSRLKTAATSLFLELRSDRFDELTQAL